MDKTVSSTTLDLQALTQDAAINQMAASSGQQSSQYATGLMDELFGEVDSILDGSLIPPTESVKVAAIPEPKAPINLDFAAFLSTPSSELGAMMAGLSSNGAPAISQDDEVQLTVPVTENDRNQVRQESYGLFEKMLIFVGCSSAMAAMVIWLGSQGTIGRMSAAIRGTSNVPVAVIPPNPSDVKFSDYMGKSLESIDSKSKVIPNLAAVPVLPSVVMPTVKVDNSTPQIILGGSGMSRLKPVPTIGRTIPTVNPPAPNAPAMSSQSNLEQTVAKLSGLVDRMTGMTNRPVAAVAPSRAVAPAAAPQSEYILSGVLGNGDKSAAMFKINGVGRNYDKGEKIGNSGWVFIRVDNGNAVVRRNGEVRTLSAGQRL
ncbi:MAG: hypothetical protein LH631_02825 [Alkalinema sp. CAN_BIN05]|nr:hypothetical protein [Alkalinema sp. CAN_BIN05]